MIDSCRLPCRIRVDTVWKIVKGGGSTDKKGGGEGTATSHVKSGRNGIAKGKRTRGFPFSP